MLMQVSIAHFTVTINNKKSLFQQFGFKLSSNLLTSGMEKFTDHDMYSLSGGGER